MTGAAAPKLMSYAAVLRTAGSPCSVGRRLARPNRFTLHYGDNVFKIKTSITLRELNAIKKMSFQSTSENR